MTLPLWVLPVIPLAGFAINGLLGTRLGKSFVTAVGVRRRGPRHARRLRPADPVRPGRPRHGRSSPSRAGSSVGNLSIDLVVPARPALGADAVVRHVRRLPDPHLRDRLHAPRGLRRRVRPLLRVPEPLPLRDADAGARRELPADVRRLGRASASARTCSSATTSTGSTRRWPDARRSSSTGSATTASCSACSASSRPSARSTTPRSSGRRPSSRPSSAPALAAICLCLFIGAMGKSAQVPLYVWLPDAMAGPTPVSALIHAATMVTAGVYMVTRCNVLFRLAPEVMLFVAVIGCFTALFAGTIAVAQNDLKKVLAYSTISQLGYMFLACGVGAFPVGMFHVMTHACFKACLFLGAGSVMHAMSDDLDVRHMGGLKSKMPITFWTFLAGDVRDLGHPALRRLLLEGRDPRELLRGARPRQAALVRRPVHGRADRLLHVPDRLADVLRPVPRHEGAGAPRARVAGLDDVPARSSSAASRSSSAGSACRRSSASTPNLIGPFLAPIIAPIAGHEARPRSPPPRDRVDPDGRLGRRRGVGPLPRLPVVREAGRPRAGPHRRRDARARTPSWPTSSGSTSSTTSSSCGPSPGSRARSGRSSTS